MKLAVITGFAVLALLLTSERAAVSEARAPEEIRPPVAMILSGPRFEQPVYPYAQDRLARDFAAVETYRPSYTFWRHVFTIPDGSVAFGSAVDGRLLAVFPSSGDWTSQGRWQDPALASLLDGERLARSSSQRRNQVAGLLEARVGPVVHNATRGGLLLSNALRYGSFMDEWGAIYERFGVPPEIGLAQAAVESGLSPTVRSEARAVGFCQWLEGNWSRLQRFAPYVIESHNQTTQAPYCAAYLSVLATKYGSFIPALSEHHAGGANVGRTLINGSWLGAPDIRGQYFQGAAFALDLRNLSARRHRDIVGTYGPRSFLYSEMVFGNTYNVPELRAAVPQVRVYAMRVPRSLPLTEVTARTGLSVDEIRRFNPALIRQVPASASLYLPAWVEEFGPDISFWHQPPSFDYASVLDEFVRMDTDPERWDDPEFQRVLRDYQSRFQETGTEEGTVMATVLAFVIDETSRSRQGEILTEYRTSPRIQNLFERSVTELQTSRRREAVE